MDLLMVIPDPCGIGSHPDPDLQSTDRELSLSPVFLFRIMLRQNIETFVLES